MALSFPFSPTTGQTYSYNGDTYVFDGKRWGKPATTQSATSDFDTLTATSSTVSSAAGRVYQGTDAGGSVSLGRVDNIASNPYIDFNSGSASTDYDVRVQASNGTGSAGQGQLNIIANNIEFDNNEVDFNNADLYARGRQARMHFYRSHWYNGVTYHHHKTDVPWTNHVQMYSIEIKGHEYGASKAVDARAVWYNYTPAGGLTSFGSEGSHPIGAYQSADGYTVIRIQFTSGYYTSYTWNQYTTAQGLRPIRITSFAANNTVNHF